MTSTPSTWPGRRTDLRARDRGAAAFRRPDRLRGRDGDLRLSHPREARRQLANRAAGDIGLGGAAVVHDLPMRKIFGRGLRELLQQHSREGEVPARQYAALAFARHGVDLCEVRLNQAGRPDDDMRAML